MTIANKLGNLVSGFMAIAIGTVLLGEVSKAIHHIQQPAIERHRYIGCPEKTMSMTITKEDDKKEDYFTKSKFD